MKLVLAVVRDTDAENILNLLVERSFRVTRIASSGGFLRRGNATLVIGVEAEQVSAVIDTLREATRLPGTSPLIEGQHRVTLFVVNAERFEHLR